jgi:hypothetical protein
MYCRPIAAMKDKYTKYNIKVLRNSRDSEFFYCTFCETLTNLTKNSHRSCIITSLPCVVNMGYEKTALVHVKTHLFRTEIANPQTPTPNYTHNSPN